MTLTAEALRDRSATSLADQIRNREVSATELMQATIAHIQQLEPSINAFISLRTVDALEEALRLDLALSAGSNPRPLSGLPIAIKDNIDVRGLATTAGSSVLPVTPADEDAESVRRITADGAIVLGKTNLHEFAYGATNVNQHWGSVHNPWRRGYIAGGSSGGSAAAVATGEAALALGTDAAGSIRMPASLSGIVGLKPTYGRVSARGLVASHNSSVDHVGPMTRTVEDAALLLEVLAGFDPLDPLSIDRPAGGYLKSLRSKDSLGGLRIGVPSNYFFDLIADDVEQVVRAALDRLTDLGATLVNVEIPDLEDMMPLRLALFADGLAFHTRYLQDDPFQYGEDVRTRLLTDHFVMARDHAQAARVRRLLQERFARVLGEVDVIASATTPVAAVPMETRTVEVVDRRSGELAQQDLGLLLLRLTAPANLTGLPAISVPCGFTGDDLPVGLQLVARPFDESTLLATAHVFEQINSSLTDKRPPL